MEHKVEILLCELLEEVRLLTVQTKTNALKKFKDEFLTSDLRKQMYNALDGEKTLLQISADIGCKINTLQVFAQSLIEKDLIGYVTIGNARVLNKSLSKIAIYYANKSLDEV